MTNEKLYEVLGDINEKYVSEARVYQKAKKPIWAKWGAIAACLVLVCVVAIPFFSHNNSVTTPGIADAAPMIYVNDTLYKQSTSQTSFTELKDNFVYLGVIESDVTNFQGTNDAGNYLDGIPKENFQANHPIVGAEVYQYGDNSCRGYRGRLLHYVYCITGGDRKNGDLQSLSDYDMGFGWNLTLFAVDSGR